MFEIRERLYAHPVDQKIIQNWNFKE